jgi:hypothetical protein
MNTSATKVMAGTSEAGDLLRLYLQSRDEEVVLVLESQLLCEEAGPIIRTVLRQRMCRAPAYTAGNCFRQNLEDIYGTVVLEVLMRLRALKRDANAAVIDNFYGYVASITYRVWSEHLRKSEPWRASLKKKLHYLLTREQAFAIWKDADEQSSCGLTSWRNQKNASANSLRTLLDHPRRFDYGVSSSSETGGKHLFELVSAIFSFMKCPIRFDDLVRTVVGHCRVERAGDYKLPDSRTNLAEEVERRILLQHTWAEIGKLPLRQRRALLLNLTDPHGHSLISLLPIIGIASLREIAKALGMSQEQLANIWHDLPLDDLAIAGSLGATRQQIINLRMTARKRLVRRRDH